MINLTVDALRDFQACTLFYQYKHLDGNVKPDTQLKKTQSLFKEALVSVVNFFFFKKLSWQEPSYKVLEGKWEKKWSKDTTAADIIFNRNSAQNQYPTDAYWASKATAALYEFHRWFSDKKQLEVLLIDEPFTVPLNKKVALNGSFDLVLKSEGKDGSPKYHVYAWSINMNNSLDYWSTHFTALDYALRYRYGNKPMDVKYYLWDFTDDKPGAREFLIEVKDHKILNIWADRVAEQESFYPIRGLSAYCKSCVYDKPCKQWRPAEEKPVSMKAKRHG